MTRHLARFRVTHEELAAALVLPEGTTILEIEQDANDRCTGVFFICVEHPDLPEVESGMVIPNVSVVVEWEGKRGP